MGKNDANPPYFGALFFLVVAIAAGLYFGASNQLTWQQVIELRGPRVLLALAVGAGLATAGVSIQAVFTNPLTDPYTLGISSGAALGAVVGSSLSLSAWASTSAAALGAAIMSIILFFVSYRPQMDSKTLLVIGVMLSFLGQSLVTIWLAFQDPSHSNQVLSWLFGDLSRAEWSASWVCLLLVVACSVAIAKDHRQLDALLLGEADALSMGIRVSSVRRRQLMLSSLLVTVCVASAGMIGFLGFLIPHFIRSRQGALHRSLIPLACIFGAAVLIVSDMAARTLVRPYELPVGALISLLGSPLFVWALYESRFRSGGD